MTQKPKRTPLLIIFVTVFIDLLGFGIVLPLLPRYAKHFHASGWMLGALMASFSVMQFVFAPLWGRVSDRIGRRPVLILGLLGSTVFYSLFGYVTDLGSRGVLLGLGVLPWLFLCRIGAGIAGATIPTAQAYIADVTGPAERAKGMALIGAAFGIGFTFGPLLGAVFVTGDAGDPQTFTEKRMVERLKITESQQRGITRVLEDYEPRIHAKTLARRKRDQLKAERDEEVLSQLSTQQQKDWASISAPSSAPGYVAGVLSFFALLSAIFLLPESLQPGMQTESRNWLELSGLRNAMSRPAIGLILATMFLTTFAFAQFESTLSLLTASLGLADRYNYFVFAYIGFILSLSQGVLVRRLVPKWGEFKMSVIGTTLMTLGFILVGISGAVESRSMLYAVLPLCVIGFSALNPSLQSLLSRRTDASQQGGILGVGQSMSALARILGPMVGLPLCDWDMAAPYWAAAILMSLGIGLTWMLRSPPPASVQ
jgi:MFS family permease